MLGQGVGIGDGLALGPAHQFAPMAVAVAPARSRTAPGFLARAALFPHAALLGFEHEGAAAVEIDAPDPRAAPAAARGDGALEDIVVALVRGVGGLWFGQAENPAQADQEELVIGALLAALTPVPTGDERLDRLGTDG
jgi:hypothetical protein